MNTTKEMSIASRMIRLFTEFPCVGTDDSNFEIELPMELSRQSYEMVVAQIEFRRKCMNQGFDNLLELLKLHFDGYQKMGGTVTGVDDEEREAAEDAAKDADREFESDLDIGGAHG